MVEVSAGKNCRGGYWLIPEGLGFPPIRYRVWAVRLVSVSQSESVEVVAENVHDKRFVVVVRF
jgi:hypothetical protein